MNKLKFNDFKKSKNNSLTVHIFLNLQNPLTFHSEEKLINLERVLCWSISILLVYGINYLWMSLAFPPRISDSWFRGQGIFQPRFTIQYVRVLQGRNIHPMELLMRAALSVLARKHEWVLYNKCCSPRMFKEQVNLCISIFSSEMQQS